jgi:hypothetical protein
MRQATRFPDLILVAVGIALAGWFVGQGFMEGRTLDHYVTVKGVAERDVSADIGLWPIAFVATDDDLGEAQKAIVESKRKVLDFLQRYGIDAGQVEVRRLDVADRLADRYRNGPTESRYIVSQTLMVRTGDPNLILKASQHTGDLVEAGVVLSRDAGPQDGPTYLFTGLNELKPEMIAEATAQARRAAEQFAKDSGSRVGDIRRANQGVFVILPRDRMPGVSESGQFHKTVRVVSTLEYLLD